MIPIEASAKQKPNTSGVGLTGSKPSRSQSRAHGFQTTTVTFTWLGIFRSDGTITKLPVGAITEMIDVSVHIAILDYDIHHICI